MSVSYLRAHHLRQPHRTGAAASPYPATPYPAAPRRTTQPPAVAGTSSPAPSSSPVTVDPLRRTATVDGRPLELTKVEFDLLAHLHAHPRQVFSRNQLLESVWRQPAVGDGRTVDVHVVRLRRKLGPRFRATLVTVRGVGYKFEPDAG